MTPQTEVQEPEVKAVERPKPALAAKAVVGDKGRIVIPAAIREAMARNKIKAIVYPTWSNAPRRVGDDKSPAGDNSQVPSDVTTDLQGSARLKGIPPVVDLGAFEF